MHPDIAMLRQTRAYLRRLTDGLTDDQLLRLPAGAPNNILWNLGHLAVTQQILHYTLSGLEPHVPAEALALFRKGTSPADWAAPPPVAQVRAWLVTLPERLAEDHAAGRFTAFQEYPTSTGIVLTSFEDALAFNTFHEGLHTTAIKHLMKKV